MAQSSPQYVNTRITQNHTSREKEEEGGEKGEEEEVLGWVASTRDEA